MALYPLSASKRNAIKAELLAWTKTPLKIAQEQEVPLERIREVMREENIRVEDIPVRVPRDFSDISLEDGYKQRE